MYFEITDADESEELALRMTPSQSRSTQGQGSLSFRSRSLLSVHSTQDQDQDLVELEHEKIGEKSTDGGENSTKVGEKSTKDDEKSTEVGEKSTKVGEKSSEIGDKFEPDADGNLHKEMEKQSIFSFEIGEQPIGGSFEQTSDERQSLSQPERTVEREADPTESCGRWASSEPWSRLGDKRSGRSKRDKRLKEINDNPLIKWKDESDTGKYVVINKLKCKSKHE